MRMGVLRRLADWWDKRSMPSLESPAWGLGSLPDWYFDNPDTGANVSETRALQLSAVYACTRILSESIASLPLFVYRRGENGSKSPAYGRAEFDLLHDSPNQVHTKFTFFDTAMAYLALRGNFVAWIERYQGSPAIKALWPAKEFEIDIGSWPDLYYRVTMLDDSKMTVRAADIVHVPGISLNGLIGLSCLGAARHAVGLGISAETFGATLFSNGARPGGVLTTDAQITKERRVEIAQAWEQAHGQNKSSNWNRVAVLGSGFKYDAVGINPEDAQFLETRRFQILDIARAFRVPPHMLGDLERATWSNVEQEAISFVVHTLRPWAIRIETELTRKIFAGTVKGRYFAEFKFDGLLRGDSLARSQGYAIAIQNGWLSRNEVRKAENLEPLDGLDEMLYPLNMGPTSNEGGGPGMPDGDSGDEEE